MRRFLLSRTLPGMLVACILLVLSLALVVYARAGTGAANASGIVLAGWTLLSLASFGMTALAFISRGRAETGAAAMRESERVTTAGKDRLTAVLASMNEAVVTTDAAGRVLSLNPTAERLTGWHEAMALNRLLGEIFPIVHEDTLQPYPSPADLVLLGESATGPDLTAILTGRDGAELEIAFGASPIQDGKGKITGVVLVFRDITQQRRAEAELLKERKLESVGLLAGGIAHDFNNILQSIVGHLSLARMNVRSEEKVLERLAALERAAFRAKDLTQQLVMFARGGAPIRRHVQLPAIIKDSALFTLQGKNTICDFIFAPDTWPVDIDEGQFRQVIHNIVLNAVQASPDGGKIEVRSENVEFPAGFLPPLNGGKYVKISIRDHGTGIRLEHLPRVFDPYFTTKNHARGLGLASAYSVIRKHDGQITVDSHVGRGSVFQVYLPVSAKVADPPSSGVERRLTTQGRILIMDDEAEILVLAREMLELLGYEVDVARNGGEALEKYMAAKSTDRSFTAVIMDLVINEGMGGKEATRRLRELDPHARVIVSSGYSYDPVMAKYQEFGFSGVIPKPYVIDDLRRVLSEVLGRKSRAAVTS